MMRYADEKGRGYHIWMAALLVGMLGAVLGLRYMAPISDPRFFREWRDPKHTSDLRLRTLETKIFSQDTLEALSGRAGADKEASLRSAISSEHAGAGIKSTSNLPENVFSSEHLRILTTRLAPAYVGEYYIEKIHVAGGTPPYRITVNKGMLPAEMYLDEQEGVLFGLPKSGAVEEIALEVTDDSGKTASKPFFFIIRRKKAGIEDDPLQLLPQELPEIIVGKRYFSEILSSGGVYPHRFKLVSGILPPGIKLLSEEGFLFGIPITPGTYPFEIEVLDTEGASERERFRIAVKDSPLYLTTPALPEGFTGTPYSFVLEAQGGAPPYRWSLRSGEWPEGLTFNPESGQIMGIPKKEANKRLVIGVMDGEENFDSAEFVLIIRGGALSVPDQELPSGVVGRFYYAPLKALGGQPPYQWNAQSRLPRGLEFAEGKVALSGVPEESFNDQITIQAMDQSGQMVNLSLQLNIVEKPLTLILPPAVSVAVGEFLFFPLFCEGGFPEYRWQLLEGSTQGFQLLDTGVLLGDPISPMNTLVKVQVSDQTGEVRSGAIPIHVLDEELMITIESIPAAQYLKSYRSELTGKGGMLPYRWSIDPMTLPDGLKLDSASGIISGVSQEHGTFLLGIRLTGGDGKFAEANFPLNIAFGQLNIMTSGLPSGLVGASYSEVIEISGGISPYIWQLVSGGFPRGLILDESTGVISGTPEEGQAATFEIEVRDGTGEKANKSYTLVVEGEALRIQTELLNEALVSKTYQHTLTAKGGIAPYTWSLKEGEWPQLLTLDQETGIISGIPKKAGDFSLSVQVEDAGGGTSLKPFTIHVKPEPLSFQTSSLPSAELGEEYDVSINVSGGVPPYSWTLVEGFLPKGLQLLDTNGSISGVPEEIAVDRTFSVEVTDSAGEKIRQSFTLTVTGEYPSPIQKFILAPGDGKVGMAWEIPSDTNIVEAGIYRGRNTWPEISSSTLIYSGRNDQWVDDGLINGQEYFYIVLTYNAAGIPSEITEVNKGSVIPRAVTLAGPNDPYADNVVSFSPLTPQGFGSTSFPKNVLGPPAGGGDRQPQYLRTELLSLHARANNDNGVSAPYGGSIVLEFNNNIVVNKPGVDFTVFENAFFAGGNFSNRFMEPAVVSVSQDGVTFFAVPFDYVPHYDDQGRAMTNNPFSYAFGFAGKEPVYSSGGVPNPTNPAVSGGDSFDLSWITAKDLKWIRFIRITASGDNWLTDRNGDLVRHTADPGALSGREYSGFDLDAVCAIHY